MTTDDLRKGLDYVVLTLEPHVEVAYVEQVNSLRVLIYEVKPSFEHFLLTLVEV